MVRNTCLLAAGLAFVGASGVAFAQTGRDRSPRPSSPPIAGTESEHPLRLASFNAQDKPATKPNQPTESEKTTVRTTERSVGGSDYREISSFFNIREANANVPQGVWEFEVPFAWETQSDGTDDDLSLGASLKYGITNDIFLEVELMPVHLGDGGDQGNGETALVLFTQWLHEDGSLPAFATWAEMRIPTGHDSSGVDGELHFNLTKTLATDFRGHLEGFIETANGARGGEDEDDRRHFQWGIGPGFDYQFNPETIGVLNYVNRSSEEYGDSNQNIVQVGLARKLAEGQWLKAAVDVGVDGRDETPNVGAKLQWSIEW